MNKRGRPEQVKVKVLGTNKDGTLETSRFNKVERGVIDGTGFNDNQLIRRSVVAECTSQCTRLKPAEWKVVQILDQDDIIIIKGVIYAEEKEVYRVHSKKFPLDFKIAKTENSTNATLEVGTSVQFDFPLDGVNVVQYNTLYYENVSVIDKKVMIQDNYYLDHETDLMRLDHNHFVFDLSFSLLIYMKKLDLGVVNAYFQLTQYDFDKVMYVLAPEQPFMSANSDAFKRNEELYKIENYDLEDEGSVYSDRANSFGYDSNFNSVNNNNGHASYSDVIDDDDYDISEYGDDRERKEAKYVAKIKQCKELIETADKLIEALYPDAIGADLAREAEFIRKNLHDLSRDHGTL
ncbi:hypothetical protein CAEBREN_17698 [Caenorhabditis brenneri]|uniref:Uncharacterized protein n=1 Tax=Caenorhabditis brenneri TaxID=135651 RepID=G0MBH8_CAEBE|nr:hypothetical protein CAEBREN_17698 [Caenorhabditis brenneri]